MAAIRLEELLQAQQKLLVQGDERAAQTIKQLEDLAKSAKLDSAMQAIQTYEAVQADKDDDRIVKATEDGLTKTTGNGLNANVVKLTNVVRDALKDNIPAEKVKQGTVDLEAARLERVSKEGAASYQPGAMASLMAGFKSLLTAKAWVKLGEGESKGMLGNAIRRKVAENEYVANQRTINPGTAASVDMKGDYDKTSRKKFREIQKIAAQQSTNEAKIEKLRAAGYTDSQIKRSGLLVGKRKELDEARAAIDPAYKAQREKEQPAKLKMPKPDTSAAKAVAEKNAIDETEAESIRMEDSQISTLKLIEENTRSLKDLPQLLGKAVPVSTQDDSGKSILGSLVDMIPTPSIGGLGGIVKKLGQFAKGALRFAAPAAAVYGAANIADWGFGQAGVGKDEKGGDIKIDTEQDDANWKRMSWFQKAESGAARAVEGVGSFLGFGNIAREGQATRIKRETDYLNAQAPNASSANGVYTQSGENVAMAYKPAAAPPAPVVVNAPTTVSNTSNLGVKSPARNTESSYAAYNRSKMAW